MSALTTENVVTRGAGMLSTRRGRLAAFFLLYVTEGIPLGFNAVAIAALMRKEGLSPSVIGQFVATLYLPWSWKWLIGPVIDLVYSKRWGRRRPWIVACQSLMALTLLLATGVDFRTYFVVFTAIIFIHNVFAAAMDVAIDALATSTLPPDERGTANGFMFAGAYLGNALGGAGVLLIMPYVPVSLSFLLVVGSIAAVVILVSLRLIEPPVTGDSHGRLSFASFLTYLRSVTRLCLSSRNGIAALAFAVLPVGGYGLGLALQSNLAVELGLSEVQIGWLSLWSTVLGAIGCVLGGMLADQLGRTRMLAFYLILTTLPSLWLAYQLASNDWIMPKQRETLAGVIVPVVLINSLWLSVLIFSFFQGLMYGTRAAMYMDLCHSEVAATQFTAYMSLMNLALAYSAFWQGRSVEVWGYPSTLVLDSVLGCVCLIPLALISLPRRPLTSSP